MCTFSLIHSHYQYLSFLYIYLYFHFSAKVQTICLLLLFVHASFTYSEIDISYTFRFVFFCDRKIVSIDHVYIQLVFTLSILSLYQWNKVYGTTYVVDTRYTIHGTRQTCNIILIKFMCELHTCEIYEKEIQHEKKRIEKATVPANSHRSTHVHNLTHTLIEAHCFRSKNSSSNNNKNNKN